MAAAVLGQAWGELVSGRNPVPEAARAVKSKEAYRVERVRAQQRAAKRRRDFGSYLRSIHALTAPLSLWVAQLDIDPDVLRERVAVLLIDRFGSENARKLVRWSRDGYPERRPAPAWWIDLRNSYRAEFPR